MKVKYDSDADAMYISLMDGKVSKTKPADDYVILDYDEKGNVIGIEILFVKERMPDLLKNLPVENVVVS